MMAKFTPVRIPRQRSFRPGISRIHRFEHLGGEVIPTQNLRVWLDAAPRFVFSDAGATSPVDTDSQEALVWKDRSPNRYSLDRGGTPVWRSGSSAEAINGHPTVQFVSASSESVSSSEVGLDLGAKPRMVFVVCRHKAAGSSTKPIMGFGNDSATGNRLWNVMSRVSVRCDGGNVIYNDDPVNTNQVSLITATQTGSNASTLEMRLDGQAITSTGSTAGEQNTNRAIFVGACTNPAGGFLFGDVSVAEVIVYEAFDAAIRLQVERYLLEKYEINTPVDYSPYMWLRANGSNNGIVLGTGSDVERWNDKTANGNDFEGFSTKYPTRVASSVNGFAAVNFDQTGTEQYLEEIATNGPLDSLFEADAEWYLAIVLNQDTFVNSRVFGMVGNNNNFGAGFYALGGAGAWRVQSRDAGAGALASWGSGDLKGAWRYFTCRCKDANTYLRHGASGTPASQVASDVTNDMTPWSDATYEVRIGVPGNSPSASDKFDGKIAEIILFNKSLTLKEQEGLERYLANRYNLS